MDQVSDSKHLQRSPTLPPLLPQSPPATSFTAPPQPRSRGLQRRFTIEEKLAFGSRPFVNKQTLAAAEARSVSPSRVARTTKPARRLATSQSEPSLPCASQDGDSGQLQEMLERMLPTHYGSFGNCSTLRPCSSADMPAMNKDGLTAKELHRPVGASRAASSFPKDVLERFRLRVLRVHRSLHEAFMPLEKRCYFAAVVGMTEVRTALSRVDTEAADELLIAIPTWPPVSLSAFFDALVISSPEAAIWELGAGMIRHGMWPSVSKRSLEDLQSYMKAHAGNALLDVDSQWHVVRDGTFRSKSMGAKADRAIEVNADRDGTCTTTRCGSKGRDGRGQGQIPLLEAAIANILPRHLDAPLWYHFCIYLGLSSSESKMLLALLGDSTHIDLRTVFEALRVTASPDISIPRLAGKAIQRYDSLRGAFHKHCTDPDHVMRWFQFLQLARALDVPDKSALRLWFVLVSRIALTDSNIDQLMADAKADRKIHEDLFVRRLAFWIPGRAMVQDLKVKLREVFGDLHGARKAFRKHGLPCDITLSAKKLGEAFTSLGITKCDPDVVIRATNRLRGNDDPADFDDDMFNDAGEVSLDDIVDAMRSQPDSNASHDCQQQSQAQALRKQLRDVRGGSSRRPSSVKKRSKSSKRIASAPPAFASKQDAADRLRPRSLERRARSNSKAPSSAQVGSSVLDAESSTLDVGELPPISSTMAKSQRACVTQSMSVHFQQECQLPQQGRANASEFGESIGTCTAEAYPAASEPMRHSTDTLDVPLKPRRRLASPVPAANTQATESMPVEPKRTTTHLVGGAVEAKRLTHVSDDVTEVSESRGAQQMRSEPRASASPTPSITMDTVDPPPMTMGRMAASPVPRSPPVMPPHRSPPVPPGMGRTCTSWSKSDQRQWEVGAASPYIGAHSPDIAPGGTSRSFRPHATRTRSMSPLLMTESNTTHASGVLTETTRPLLPFKGDAPRNAWSTASQWRNRGSISESPAPISRLVADDHSQELRLSGSDGRLRDSTAEASSQNEANSYSKSVGAQSDSLATNDFGLSAQASTTHNSGADGTVLRMKTRPWR